MSYLYGCTLLYLYRKVTARKSQIMKKSMSSCPNNPYIYNTLSLSTTVQVRGKLSFINDAVKLHILDKLLGPIP